MTLTKGELEFLAAWAREEWQPACYQLPAHRLQLDHGVTGAHLILIIKAWTQAEHKKDKDILDAAADVEPIWPWPTAEDFQRRLNESNKLRIQGDVFVA
jgi:hypothetical protein